LCEKTFLISHEKDPIERGVEAFLIDRKNGLKPAESAPMT
jgi:hypothetical protein